MGLVNFYKQYFEESYLTKLMKAILVKLCGSHS